jgi:hypothetical protein
MFFSKHTKDKGDKEDNGIIYFGYFLLVLVVLMIIL